MTNDLSAATLWKSDSQTMNAPNYFGTMVVRKSLLKTFVRQLEANGYPDEIKASTALWLNELPDGRQYLSFQLSPYDDKKKRQPVPKKQQQPALSPSLTKF